NRPPTAERHFRSRTLLITFWLPSCIRCSMLAPSASCADCPTKCCAWPPGASRLRAYCDLLVRYRIDALPGYALFLPISAPLIGPVSPYTCDTSACAGHQDQRGGLV